MKSKQNPLVKEVKGIYSSSLKKLEAVVFYLLIFLLPTQLAYHFWPDYAFVFGIRVDYLAPAIYLTDLLVIFLVAVSRTKIKTIYLFAYLLICLFNIIYSISPWASFWKWLKILELIFFAKWVFDNKVFVKSKTFVKVFSCSLLTISAIGIAQFFWGKTLGGIFYFLGERSFNIATPGIALQALWGKDFLRAYSIFSHPNSFAGFLVVAILLLKNIGKIPKLLIAIVSLAFILTFSLSAFIGVATIFLVGAFSKRYMPVGIFAASEVVQRLELTGVAKDVIQKNFLTGTGLNTFVLFNRLLQPVHNIFLLVLAETGVFGLAAFLFLFFKGLKKSLLIFIFILVTGLFDHYWLTLQQNLLLLALVFGMVL